MIESVRLHQMRSWADGTVALTPGAHIFWGENGAGKTTILEACIIAATGRSHRAGASTRSDCRRRRPGFNHGDGAR